MSIWQKALDGSLLTEGDLQPFLGYINEPDTGAGGRGLTPLCAACSGGHLDTVKLLLGNGADPNKESTFKRTPLYFLTDAQYPTSAATRCAIIRALASGQPNNGLKADLNAPCDDDENTPIESAILQLKEEKYATVFSQLIASGAKTDIPNPRTQKTAKDLAEDHSMSSFLRTKADKDALWAKFIDLTVSLVLLVVAYVNNKTVNSAVGSIVKKYYDITVKEKDVPKELQKEVEPKSVKEFQSFLKAEITKDKTFENFFSQNDPFIEKLAEKANAITQDDTTDLGKPENIKHLTQLSLYAPFIYCDDSGSMRNENRYENQIELVKRIARIATKIVPDDMSGVELRFINNPFAEQVTAENIEEAMKRVPAKGQTNIGTNLRRKILEPFVYSKISQPFVAGKPFSFRRPLLVCIITDGVPDPEGMNTLRDEIVFCKNELKKWKYDQTAVKFCINQIGTSPDAKEFLEGLGKEESIKDVVHCTAGELGAEFANLRENERALESWLLHILTKPIMERHAT